MGTFDTGPAREASLESILVIFKDLGASEIFVKKLAPNDNSKNQAYFGGHLTDLPFIPTGDMIPSESSSAKTTDPKRKIKFQAFVKLTWIDCQGQTYAAPNAKLIYYPQYPEVRFSGFLQGSRVEAGTWMDPRKRGRSEGRWLILGVSSDETVYAYLAIPDSRVASELGETELIDAGGTFGEIDRSLSLAGKSTRELLVDKLLEIYRMGWIPSQKLSSDLTSTPYKARNGGGYTLEAMLGICPNGYAEPDYLGWEVKQFSVKKFPQIGASPTTLMTPEPDGGMYKDQGPAEFVRQFGYPDTSGIHDRLNFGGRHVFGTIQYRTGLKLELLGFDTESASICDAAGVIALLTNKECVVASWSFAKLMDHWKRKHAKAVYIPCLRKSCTSGSGGYEYHFGSNIELGTGTDFEMVLASIAWGNVYYDPGIKLEFASSDKPILKRRSQFRVNHKNLGSLYHKFEFLEIGV